MVLIFNQYDWHSVCQVATRLCTGSAALVAAENMGNRNKQSYILGDDTARCRLADQMRGGGSMALEWPSPFAGESCGFCERRRIFWASWTGREWKERFEAAMCA